MGNIFHCSTPILLYFIYTNVVYNNYFSTMNKILIGAVILCRIIRVYCSYYS